MLGRGGADEVVQGQRLFAARAGFAALLKHARAFNEGPL